MVIVKSKLKASMLKELDNKPLSPVLLSKVLKRPRPSVSRALIELQDEGFVKLANPDDEGKWRFYEITAKGKKAFKDAQRYL